MAQIHLTESQIRKLYSQYTNQEDYSIIVNSIDELKNLNLKEGKKYVVKTDVLLSNRFKKGLIKVNITAKEAKDFIKDNFGRISETFVIQPFLKIEKEYYVSFETFHDYDLVRFSENGGVEIENNWGSVKEERIDILNEKLPAGLPFYDQLNSVYQFFRDKGFAFLEINPFFIENDLLVPVDFKGRIDSTFSDNYKFEKDKSLSESENTIKKLDASTGASLKFTLLNPDGKVWPMIAGGGASIVYFDLISERFGIDSLGFYGEYSGNPTAELTFVYADEIIKNTLKSKSKNKILVIAGGNANFTDIDKTFQGIIQALDRNIKEIKKQDLQIIVRRAGPNDTIGLKKMKDFLNKNEIKNKVFGIETEMYEIFDK